VKISASAAELTAGYEALRAGAIGARPQSTPRGLAVLARSGLPGWLCAFPPAERRTRTACSPPCSSLGPASEGPSPRAGAELVRLLAEMALAVRRGCYA